eukprot:205396-Rhodomonas_salina.3
MMTSASSSRASRHVAAWAAQDVSRQIQTGNSNLEHTSADRNLACSGQAAGIHVSDWRCQHQRRQHAPDRSTGHVRTGHQRANAGR